MYFRCVLSQFARLPFVAAEIITIKQIEIFEMSLFATVLGTKKKSYKHDYAQFFICFCCGAFHFQLFSYSKWIHLVFVLFVVNIAMGPIVFVDKVFFLQVVFRIRLYWERNHCVECIFTMHVWVNVYLAFKWHPICWV